MKLSVLKLQPYNLPFKTPWHTSHGSMEYRQGFILRLEADNGLVGLGDCAPMREMGTESLAYANRQCQKLALLIESEQPGLSRLLNLIGTFPPATAMAVETALLDIQSQLRQLPLCKWLNPNAGNSCKVNINLGRIDENLLIRSENTIKKGFNTLKIKVGTNSTEYEIKILEQLLDRYKDMEINWRLDANQAWSFEQATWFICALNGFAADAIEYLEEPLASPSFEQLVELQYQAHFPLAIDESLMQFDWDKIIQNNSIKHIILKAGLVGGISKTLALAKKLQAADIQITVTSLLESVVGITANLHLACAVDNNISHGLLSGKFFQYDLDKSPPLKKQHMLVTNTSGLGIRFKNLEFNHGNI